MENITEYLNNTVPQRALQDELNTGILVKVIFSMTLCLIFLYVNGIMLFTLSTRSTFRETSRYILFAHMLFNDSIQLLTSMLLYIFASVSLHFITGVCAILFLIASITYCNSPLNLAMMALERYIAICFPLRHSEIATPKRTGMAIGVIWFFGSMNDIIRIMIILITEPLYFLSSVHCTTKKLFRRKMLLDVSTAFTALYFVAVTLIIIYTYVAIMLEARSVSCEKISVTKARNTVLLHFFQLALCLTSFLHGVMETLASNLDGSVFLTLQYILFIVLIIFPRCLSPLIYGLRDESFRPLVKYYFMFALRNRVKPHSVTI
ncbi:odorant receptor 131-2-like [Amia ocellicauda]|uniref:odorant receptor 131-2-like n=1 Tax=Amia ocellicauda TaxID=2972642 RepID=UPI003463C959